MSEQSLVVSEDELVETTLSLKKLLDQAREALPEPKIGVQLSLGDKAIFYKVIASKISHGYQLEFVMQSGEVHYGFVIGLDDFVVQIYETGYGRDFERNISYDTESYEVGAPSRRWLALEHIESVGENFFGIKHLTEDSRKALNNERRAVVKIAEKWLYPYSRNGR